MPRAAAQDSEAGDFSRALTQARHTGGHTRPGETTPRASSTDTAASRKARPGGERQAVADDAQDGSDDAPSASLRRRLEQDDTQAGAQATPEVCLRSDANMPTAPADETPWLPPALARHTDAMASGARLDPDAAAHEPRGIEGTARARADGRADGRATAAANTRRVADVADADDNDRNLPRAAGLQKSDPGDTLLAADFGPLGSTAQASAQGLKSSAPEPAPAAGQIAPLSEARPAADASTLTGKTPANGLVEREIPAPLHAPGFAPALGAQLTLLVKDGVTEARLHLNPVEMGPIAVQIQVDGTQARVEMVADQAQTRHALEQSMPSLASALRDSGLTLAGGGVFDQPTRQGAPDDDASRSGTATRGGATGGQADDGSGTLSAALPAGRPRGVVDLYA